MIQKTNPLPFFLTISIVVILVIGSWARLDNDIDKVDAIYQWIDKKPASLKQSSIPFDIPLCSMSGRRITFWKSKSFRVDFFAEKWSEAHYGVYALTKSGIDFMWHNKQNFMEEDLPLPDKGRHWKSPSKNFFVYYFGNYYSNLYCRHFQTLN
ncbi:MAG: hypothetical protein EP319_18190 [Deltaproteobacteria bacterium]|nr:MAG: hypothetical protein EP319_18190 [Deltaproteobacteria bacterium]